VPFYFNRTVNHWWEQQFPLKTAETASLIDNATPEVNSGCYKGENLSPLFISHAGIQRELLYVIDNVKARLLQAFKVN
jgi:hypothetical protein